MENLLFHGPVYQPQTMFWRPVNQLEWIRRALHRCASFPGPTARPKAPIGVRMALTILPCMTIKTRLRPPHMRSKGRTRTRTRVSGDGDGEDAMGQDIVTGEQLGFTLPSYVQSSLLGKLDSGLGGGGGGAGAGGGPGGGGGGGNFYGKSGGRGDGDSLDKMDGWLLHLYRIARSMFSLSAVTVLLLGCGRVWWHLFRAVATGDFFTSSTRLTAVRLKFCKTVLLALDFLLAGDVIETLGGAAKSITLRDVAMLIGLVLLRAVLAHFLDVEIRRMADENGLTPVAKAGADVRVPAAAAAVSKLPLAPSPLPVFASARHVDLGHRLAAMFGYHGRLPYLQLVSDDGYEYGTSEGEAHASGYPEHIYLPHLRLPTLLPAAHHTVR